MGRRLTCAMRTDSVVCSRMALTREWRLEELKVEKVVVEKQRVARKEKRVYINKCGNQRGRKE